MTQSVLIPSERIEKSIYLIRGEKVMLDRDLAALYGVETKVLKQAVRRNMDRFPADFMFVLNPTEFHDWRSQFVTSKTDRKGLRYPPMAFTEHGILMLSSVLNSKRAINVNIEITRAFVRLRKMLASNAELSRRVDNLENKYDGQLKLVFDAIRTVMAPSPAKRKQIGFRQDSNNGTRLKPELIKFPGSCVLTRTYPQHYTRHLSSFILHKGHFSLSLLGEEVRCGQWD